ncbi:hypothetical protein ADUPG1_004987, partial [Aduncisulcus paluster]
VHSKPALNIIISSEPCCHIDNFILWLNGMDEEERHTLFREREREQARTRMSRGQRSQAVAVSSILDHIGEEERGFDSESFTRLPSECFEDVDIEVPLDTPPAWYSIVSSLRHHQHDLAEISESETTHCTDTLSDDSHPVVMSQDL